MQVAYLLHLEASLHSNSVVNITAKIECVSGVNEFPGDFFKSFFLVEYLVNFLRQFLDFADEVFALHVVNRPANFCELHRKNITRD